MSNSCSYCPHGRSGDCLVDWDRLEYSPDREATVRANCRKASERAAEIDRKRQSEKDRPMPKRGICQYCDERYMNEDEDGYDAMRGHMLGCRSVHGDDYRRALQEESSGF